MFSLQGKDASKPAGNWFQLLINKNEMDGTCGTYEREREEMHTGLWWGNLRKKGYFENKDVDGTIILI